MAQEAGAQQRRTAATAPVAAPRSWHGGGNRFGRRLAVLRPLRSSCALRRVHRDCEARHGRPGTLMRHDLLGALSLAIAQGPTGMREASSAAALVVPPSAAQRLAPGTAGALTAAITLAPVTAAAHQHLDAAGRTAECPGAALDLALPCSMHRRLAQEASTSQRRSRNPPQRGRTLMPWCHTANALAIYARVGRGDSYRLPHRFGRRARFSTGHRSTATRTNCSASAPLRAPHRRGAGGNPQ